MFVLRPMLMQSVVLQSMGSNYPTHLKYFGITNGIVFVIKKQTNNKQTNKLCKPLVYKYALDFATGPLPFWVIVI